MKAEELVRTSKPSPVKFAPGEVVLHNQLGYRAVILEVDERFCGPDELLTDLRGKRAPKNRPWYYVLVDGADTIVYVAERYLIGDETGRPIRHPLVDSVFTNFENGRYTRLNH